MSENKGKDRIASAKEIKSEFINTFNKVRSQEIRAYYEELSSFLQERDIDLKARVVIDEDGSRTHEIVIVDRL